MQCNLSLLRERLCKDAQDFCKECFAGSPYEAVQNPPNVFRVGKNLQAKIFFIFDKPNNNDGFRSSDLVPITICDPRPIFGPPATHRNLLLLLDILGLRSERASADPLDSEAVHVTNAVKCDKCAVTGQTGRVAIGETQARKCVSRFLSQELAIIRPSALIFFGEAPERNVLGYSTPLWVAHQASVAGESYWVMRVPHTSPTSFNTHGGRGEHYREPFQKLLSASHLRLDG